MTKMEVDSMYKDNLSEWIYDEHKLITYHYLSVTLGVHINMAKQMLYEFYTEEKKKQKKGKGRKLEAMFLLSGTEARTGDSDELLKCTTTLCSDEKLEEQKSKLKSLYSVHVYSLQSLLPEDDCLSKLKDASVEATFLKDDEGRCGVDFGPYKLLKAMDVKKSKPAPVIPATEKPDDTKSKSRDTATDKKPKVISPAKPEKTDMNGVDSQKSQNGGQSTNSKKAPTPTPQGHGSKKKPAAAQNTTALKNMFAAAASKPRAQKKAKSPSPVRLESSDENSRDGEDDMPETPKAAANKTNKKSPKVEAKKSAKKPAKAKPEPSRKRRRIQEVFSSSSDDEGNASDKMDSFPEDEDHLPESPIPHKRLLIDSDSEDDFEKPNSKIKTESPETPCLPGKKRVRKTVSKTYMDENGYMLTMKEQVLVSESESDEDKKPVVSPDKDKPDQEIKLESRDNSKARQLSPSPKKKLKSKVEASSKKSDSQKMKQSSLTSFFQKKS